MTPVTVTAGHLAAGTRQDPERCPIALALHDAFPAASYIAVNGEAITLNTCTDDPFMWDVEITPPPEVAAFVDDFDAWRPVQPFKFELDYPAVTS